MLDNILDVQNIEDIKIELEIRQLNFSNKQEFVKLLKVLKHKKMVKIKESNLISYYERNQLYEALVFHNTKSNNVYKKIISTNGDKSATKIIDNYLLPVGSVVELTNKDKVLIISRGIVKEEQYLEYLGCDYVYGYSSGAPKVFNHQMINKILSLPFEDDKTIDATIQLKDWLDNK